MATIGELWRRLQFRFKGEKFDHELAEEMRLHVELLAEEKKAAGLAAEEAKSAAKRQFGNQARLSENSREACAELAAAWSRRRVTK